LGIIIGFIASIYFSFVIYTNYISPHKAVDNPMIMPMDPKTGEFHDPKTLQKIILERQKQKKNNK
jgi:hypothetical protein